ncbi:histidine phosphatase superfamily [Gymnopilus junonius]|uniref:Histidine phosphatase superfamily n=1 Tax=Gymnopilus junonius TaxID=109634 RepID=A0A9P5TJ59_GYMJU|nr:histidine phosphatase superfamily [Gymnopilus junonius]
MAHTMSEPHLEINEGNLSPEEAYLEEGPGPEEGRPLLSFPGGVPTSNARSVSLEPFNGGYGSPDAGVAGVKVFGVQEHVNSRKRSGWPSVLLHSSLWTLARSFLKSSSGHRHYSFIFLVVSVISLVVILSLYLSEVIIVNSTPRNSAIQRPPFPPVIQNSWGAYTPYFPVQPYPLRPSHCTITQVNLIQRHGARFPTSGASARIKAALQKLQSATDFLDPKLKFLENYTYTLGENDLVAFGAAQSVDAGKEAYNRYSSLISQDNLPFVRASLSSRVVHSANNWTAGFSLASDEVFTPVLSVVLDEKLNDTLDDAMCPNAGTSDPQTSTWTSIYGAPIAARLNAQAPGATLTSADISNLIPLCAFETLATGNPSPFCDLFALEEFEQYEYNGDLDKFYGTGYGQPLGPVQGVGYINELLARLTESPVRDNTQTNRTLDSSPITFPVNRTFYADFSHDNQMIAIYAAMGLFKQPGPLDPTKMDTDPGRTWVTSHLTPFSGRMVVERLSCSLTDTSLGRFGRRVDVQRKDDEVERGTFVRVLVNDALQPLEFCDGDADGLCALDAFVRSQAYARNDGEGDFEKCFS